jgi:hypothetical protein
MGRAYGKFPQAVVAGKRLFVVAEKKRLCRKMREGKLADLLKEVMR